EILTEFMVPGLAKGENLPATYIKPDQQFAKWAEGSIHLGWWIGSLALEYNYIIRFGNRDWTHPLDSVKKRLYLALKAADRIDKQAEIYFPACTTTGTPSLNGFFIRDDVGYGLIPKFPGIDSIASDFLGPKESDKEMSQDQAYHLLLGLELARKFIPPSHTYNGESLIGLAKSRELEILKWIRRLDWQITNPVCDDGNGNERNVARGDDARFFSFPLAKLAFTASNGTVDYFGSVNGFYQLGWEFMADPNSVIFANSDNRHMAMVLASMSDGWANATQQALVDHANREGWWVYPLVHTLLHDKKRQIAEDSLRNQLELAPHPIFSPFPDTLTSGWASSHKYISYRSRQNASDLNSKGRKYSGVDYLLAFTLLKHAEKATGLAENTVDYDLVLFPNPSTGKMHLSAQGNHKPEVYNSMGSQCKVDWNANTQELDFGNLKGVFIVRVEGKTARVLLH
ncbi:MAG: hypothetical protein ACJAY8_001154, partial [Sphingobacteriales bacterium]